MTVQWAPLRVCAWSPRQAAAQCDSRVHRYVAESSGCAFSTDSVKVWVWVHSSVENRAGTDLDLYSTSYLVRESRKVGGFPGTCWYQVKA